MSMQLICAAPGCQKPFHVPPSQAHRRRFHSRACASQAGSKIRLPNLLAQRCWRHMTSAGLSRIRFADLAGISYPRFYSWLTHEHRTLRAADLAAIAAALGISFEQAKHEAGDQTAEERLRDIAERNLVEDVARRSTAHRRAIARLGGLAHKGVPETAIAREHYKAAAATERRSQARQASIDGLADANGKPEIRALRSLQVYLRWHPRPGPRVVRRQAELVAERLDLCVGQVTTWWNAELAARAVAKLGGHPTDVGRCDAMRHFASSRPWTGKQRPRRWWDGAPEGPAWCEGHARGCPTLRRALANTNVIRTSPHGSSIGSAIRGGLPLSSFAGAGQPE